MARVGVGVCLLLLCFALSFLSPHRLNQPLSKLSSSSSSLSSSSSSSSSLSSSSHSPTNHTTDHHTHHTHTTHHTRDTSKGPDPLAPLSWHLAREIAVDFLDDPDYKVHINITLAWKRKLQGTNITITIADSFIDLDNPDLKSKVNLKLSDHFTYDTYERIDQAKGTSIAGVAAGAAFNGYCGLGVAFNASIVGVQVTPSDDPRVRSSVWRKAFAGGQDVCVSTMGGDLDGLSLLAPTAMEKFEISNAMRNGRRGRGGVIVVGSGDGREKSDNCNFNAYVSNVFTIVVGSVGYNGLITEYSEPCAAQHIVAPSMYNHFHPGIATTTFHQTDNTSSNSNANGGGCTDKASGTAVSAGIVAGVVALMLEANPRLSPRDVQHILVRTANSNIIGLESEWFVNGGGLRVHSDFGFGVVDANQAVEMAMGWVNVDPFYLLEKENDGHWIIDNVTEVRENVNNDFLVEHACLTVTITHRFSGDLKISLVSPFGTESILASPRRLINRVIMISAVDNWGDGLGFWSGVEADFGLPFSDPNPFQDLHAVSSSQQPCERYTTRAEVHVIPLPTSDVQQSCSYVEQALLAQSIGAKVVIFISENEMFTLPRSVGYDMVRIHVLCVSSAVGRALARPTHHSAVHSFTLMYDKPEVPPFQKWQMCSVRSWGEQAQGDWIIRISDEIAMSPLAEYPPAEDLGTLLYYKLSLYGTSAQIFNGAILSSPYFVTPEDPAFLDQWHHGLDGDTGAVTLNLNRIWEKNIVGSGIKMAILNEYVDVFDEDLANNIDNTNSDMIPGQRVSHGTSMATLAGGASNHYCGVGVAYELRLSWVLMTYKSPLLARLNAFKKCRSNDICLFEITDGSPLFVRPSVKEIESIELLLEHGRNGNGPILIWGSGDQRAQDVTCDYNGYLSMPYGIVVGSVAQDGVVASFSSQCPSLLVVAPSGDVGKAGVVTADNGRKCEMKEGGRSTSSSAALVSGVIALMLQARSDLSYRDVQHILIKTARRNVLKSDSDWTVNGAGYFVHDDFGFGLVDGSAALAKSITWPKVSRLRMIQLRADVFGTLRPGDHGYSFVSFSSDNFYVERVVVEVDVTAISTGNMKIYLKAPSGTVSKFIEPRLSYEAPVYYISLSAFNDIVVLKAMAVNGMPRGMSVQSIVMVPIKAYCVRRPQIEMGDIFVYTAEMGNACTLNNIFHIAQELDAKAIFYVTTAHEFYTLDRNIIANITIPIFMFTSGALPVISNVWKHTHNIIITKEFYPQQDLSNWTFSSVRHFGEEAAGEWRLYTQNVLNAEQKLNGNQSSVTVNWWKITLYGHGEVKSDPEKPVLFGQSVITPSPTPIAVPTPPFTFTRTPTPTPHFAPIPTPVPVPVPSDLCCYYVMNDFSRYHCACTQEERCGVVDGFNLLRESHLSCEKCRALCS